MSISAAAQKRGKSDLYRTPHKAIVPLVKTFSYLRNKKILDPCQGDCRIRQKLETIDKSNTVTGFDLYPSDPNVQPVDFLKHYGRYDYIIGNPPFSLKSDFIDHGLEISEYVIFLLNMSTVSYNIFHRNYLNRPEYMGRLLMTPKMFMNSEGTFKPGGTDSYAWFIWKNGHNTRGSFEYYFDLRKLT